MAIVPLSLSQNVQARALLHHLLEHGDIVGRDATGRTIIQLAVDDQVLEALMTFGADAAELEPEPDEEESGPPLLLDVVRPKAVKRRRVIPFGGVGRGYRVSDPRLAAGDALHPQRIDRLIDQLEQICGGGPQGTGQV